MQHELSLEDNGTTIRVQEGDVLLVRLEENPTTGYAWAEDEGTAGALILQQSNFEVFTGAGIGGGGVRSFIFHLEAGGGGVLRLKNWQRWSGDVHQRFEVRVEIG